MITVHEAHEIIAATLTPCGPAVAAPLRQLRGRVLAEEILAEFAMPRFTNAAMDGFAVRHNEIAGTSEDAPVTLPVSQELAAGALSTEPLAPQTCARIMTGAPVPEGADTVVPFEQTSGFESDAVEFYKAPKQGANIRHAGEEVGAGALLAAAGTRVTPAEIGLLATFGVASALVRPQPRVSIITVGDELRLPGEPIEPLAIYNSNLPLLEACVEAAGAEVTQTRQLRDDREAIREALAAAIAESDVIVTAGGISTGEFDFMHETLGELGVEQKFWKVALKPGKPLYFGSTASGKLVFSLPGNPVSALVCLLEYALPALALMQGATPAPKFTATLDEPFPADRKRHRFLFGATQIEHGEIRCRISQQTDSHMLTALRGADCLIEAEASPEPLPAGSLVTCSWLPWANAF
ncbi:molybdopterin molybdenumtransferase MoeA [Chlorobaculum sp. 24CR]|uniref:molybdopterin molybdotransferase MoeA n=1 Tax=Chlorobaculum sp. 24CR TaxID=2508878 RepID=UPI00100B5EDB|nr:gephyrin-like molybdotransferase Glp [Chlorobaculum sp. 24CR]RXK85092.1 molybdopterin molybdenumtransferase MoeA [Chlorobaculum sp. 24CR]